MKVMTNYLKILIDKYFNFKTGFKIYTGFALFRFYTIGDIITANIVVRILIEIPMSIGLIIAIIYEDIKKVKVKDILLKTFYVTFGINMIYLLLFGVSKFISTTTEEHCVPVTDYSYSNPSGRRRISFYSFEIEFNGQEKRIRCGSEKIENLRDKYGRDFQDSVQMQLKLKKVLPGVYGLDSYKIVKKTPQEP